MKIQLHEISARDLVAGNHDSDGGGNRQMPCRCAPLPSPHCYGGTEGG